jgi:hypothetical protein
LPVSIKDASTISSPCSWVKNHHRTHPRHLSDGYWISVGSAITHVKTYQHNNFNSKKHFDTLKEIHLILEVVRRSKHRDLLQLEYASVVYFPFPLALGLEDKWLSDSGSLDSGSLHGQGLGRKRNRVRRGTARRVGSQVQRVKN